MDLSELKLSKAILPHLQAATKKKTLQALSAKAAGLTGIPEKEIFDAVLQREKLGSTGFGDGIAIPHAKLNGLNRIIGVFARLETPVEFDAIDDEPVDLVFLLLTSEHAESEHLKALAQVARLLHDTKLTAKLRETSDPETLYQLLTDADASHAS